MPNEYTALALGILIGFFLGVVLPPVLEWVIWRLTERRDEDGK